MFLRTIALVRDLQFRQVRIGFVPSLLNCGKFVSGRRGIALMLGDQRQSVVSAGIIGVMLLHLFGNGRSKIPVVGIPGDAVEEFKAEEGLDPRIRALG